MVLLNIWVILGRLLIVAGVIAVFRGHPVGGFYCLAIGGAPQIILYVVKAREKERRASAHVEMLAAAGVASNAGWDHAEQDSGVAVNMAARTLTLLSNGKRKTYPFSDVREWSSNLATASQVVPIGGGFAGAFAMGSANVAAGLRAASATGFFVTVRDMENPKWRIEMSSESVQARWMEILEQAINESHAPT